MTEVAPPAVVTTAPAATVAPPGDNVTPAATGVVIAPSSGSEVVTTPAATTSPETTAWLATLDAESRELAVKKNWKDNNAALKSYSELERMASSRTTPETPATYKADAYTFALPENAKEINYSEEFATGFKSMCADAGISPEMAGKVHDWYTKYATDSFGTSTTAHATEVAGQITKAQGDLVAAWGTENNPAFKRNAELAQRAITQLGVMPDLIEAGHIIETANGKTVANANIMKAFAKVGLSMYAEDTVFGQVANGVNPFDPKTANQGEQGALIRNDPEKALLLIQSLPQSDQGMWAPVLPSIRARVGKK